MIGVVLMITVNSTLSYKRQTVPPLIPVVQGDTGRNVSFGLSDYTIPEEAEATFYIQKPSGAAIYNTAEIVSANQLLVPLDAQCLAEAGENFGQVRILVDGEVITSFDFILLVKPFRGIDAVESQTEMNIFDQAVEQAMEEIGAILDPTLSIQNKAADAKATGDAIQGVIDSIIPLHSEDAFYSPGDVCRYNGTIYVCCPVNGSIISGDFFNQDWIEVSSMSAYVERALNMLCEAIAKDYNTNITYNIGDYCFRYQRLYVCKENGTTGTWAASKWTMVTLPGLINSNKVSFSDPNHDGHITIRIGS